MITKLENKYLVQLIEKRLKKLYPEQTIRVTTGPFLEPATRSTVSTVNIDTIYEYEEDHCVAVNLSLDGPLLKHLNKDGALEDKALYAEFNNFNYRFSWEADYAAEEGVDRHSWDYVSGLEVDPDLYDIMRKKFSHKYMGLLDAKARKQAELDLIK